MRLDVWLAEDRTCDTGSAGNLVDDCLDSRRGRRSSRMPDVQTIELNVDSDWSSHRGTARPRPGGSGPTSAMTVLQAIRLHPPCGSLTRPTTRASVPVNTSSSTRGALQADAYAVYRMPFRRQRTGGLPLCRRCSPKTRFRVSVWSSHLAPVPTLA